MELSPTSYNGALDLWLMWPFQGCACCRFPVEGSPAGKELLHLFTQLKSGPTFFYDWKGLGCYGKCGR